MKILIFACISATKTQLERITIINLQLPPNTNSGTAFLLLLGQKTAVLIAKNTTIIPHQQRENQFFTGAVFTLIAI